MRLDKNSEQVHFSRTLKSRDKTLTVRFFKHELDAINKAARVNEQSMNLFIVQAAREMAARVLKRNPKTPESFKTSV